MTSKEVELVADLMEQGQHLMSNEGEVKGDSGLRWKRTCFTAKEVCILNNVWGEVKSGTFCAVLGPSGSGKSSLLNVLAGRSASVPGSVSITTDVEVANVRINPVSFRQNIAYVMQDDALMSTSTPREALEFSAQMRLPSDTSKDAIKAKVEGMLVDLGLTECANTMIGGALIKGISGGQRKRVSVGIELITNPKLLFLDEPTVSKSQLI